MPNDEKFSMDDREVTIPNDDYRKLLQDSNLLKSIVGLRKSWNGLSLMIDVNVIMLEDLIREELAKSPLSQAFEIQSSEFWVNPQVYIGTRRRDPAQEVDGN